MNQDIAESRHPFQFHKKFFGDRPLLGKNLENLTIGFRFPIPPVRYHMIADVQQALYGEMEITLRSAMYKGFRFKSLRINLLHGPQCA